MNFGNWDSSSHTAVEQIKRITSAQKISSSKIQLLENSNAIISGSGTEPYIVTLNSCTCSDFQLRHLPCKHIYCLALKLGYLTDLPTLNSDLSANFNQRVPDEISRYYAEYLSGSISGEKFVKIAEALKKGK